MPTGQVESRPGSEDPDTESLINSEGGKSCIVPCILNEAPVATGSTPTSSTPGFAVTAHRETSTVMFRRLLSLVKIEHTLFALPLAFTGSHFGSQGHAELESLGAGRTGVCGSENRGHGIQSVGGSPLGCPESANSGQGNPVGSNQRVPSLGPGRNSGGDLLPCRAGLELGLFLVVSRGVGDSACLFLFQALHLVVPLLLGTMSGFSSSGRLAGRHGTSGVDSRGLGNRGSLLGCRL